MPAPVHSDRKEALTSAALAVALICTHRCRVYPELKLSPRHCEIRKEMAATLEHNWLGPFYNPNMAVDVTSCKKCEGPVASQDAPQP